ncbi:unnamed protein product [Rhodiola kirilowii]
MRIISWNYRVVGGTRAVRSICDVVSTHRPSFLGLVKMKKSDGEWEALRCKLGFKGCLSVRGRGKAGGLALLWGEEVDVDLLSFSHSHIDVCVRGDCCFHLTVFYGNPRTNDRAQSWELLRKLRRDADKACVVMGDFNEVLFSGEMDSKRERRRWQMNNFKECLADCGLSDLGFEGEMFTYSNIRQGEEEVRARLDRVVVNQAWKTAFPQASVRHAFVNSSDHLPIVLSMLNKERGCKRRIVRFEPMWLRHKGFKDVVRKYWNESLGEKSLAKKLGCACKS